MWDHGLVRLVPAVTARALLCGFFAAGLDGEALRRQARLPADDVLADPEAHVEEQALIDLWRRAAAVDERPELPTIVGLAVPLGAFGLLDYLASSAPSVASSITAVARSLRLVSAGFRLDIEGASGPSSRVRVRARFDAAEPHTEEFVLALLLGRMRSLAAHPFAVHQLLLTRSRPRRRTRHADLLGAPVRFGAESCAMELDQAAWQTPLRSADPLMQATLAHVAAQLSPADETSDLELAVRAHLKARLGDGNARMNAVAGALGMSGRTLQRQLSALGLELRALLASEREREAERLLADTRRSLAEIALALGYADQAGFTRSFRRWKGMTPTEWRASRHDSRTRKK